MSTPHEGVSVKDEPDPMITLKVLDTEGRRAVHKMRMSDKLQGLMDAYYAVPDVTYGTGTFMFDNSVRLRGCRTPADLDLIDGDEINFYETQVGGARDGAWD